MMKEIIIYSFSIKNSKDPFWKPQKILPGKLKRSPLGNFKGIPQKPSKDPPSETSREILRNMVQLYNHSHPHSYRDQW